MLLCYLIHLSFFFLDFFFKLILQAYDTLKDSLTKELYDTQLKRYETIHPLQDKLSLDSISPHYRYLESSQYLC